MKLLILLNLFTDCLVEIKHLFFLVLPENVWCFFTPCLLAVLFYLLHLPLLLEFCACLAIVFQRKVNACHL